MKSGSIEGDGREVTLEEAADILNVSVEYVVGLLDQGAMLCRDVDGRPRISVSDLLAYKRRAEADRRDVLDELTTEAENHGLGY